MRTLLVAVQVALTVVLLSASLVLGRGFLQLLGTDIGYDTRNVASLSVSLAGTRHSGKEQSRLYSEQVLERIRRVPGVKSVSGAEYLPLATAAFSAGRFRLDRQGEPVAAIYVPVLPGFFSTMGGRLLYGRDLGPGDEDAVVVSEEFARRFGDAAHAVGRLVTDGRSGSPRVVGVVRALRYRGPQIAGGEQIFVLSRSPLFMTFVARTHSDATDALAAIRDAAASVDPTIPVFNIKTMDARLRDAMVRPRFYTSALIFLGGFAVLLALLGVYGVVSCAVSQRTRELGIRLALGTTPTSLRARLLRDAMLTVAAGAVPGVLLARFAARFLQHLMPEAQPLDAGSLIAAVLLLALTAGVSVWSATRRVARIELAETLRAY
jgi:ABC-type antimicrobial peptide transport system permease subunit